MTTHASRTTALSSCEGKHPHLGKLQEHITVRGQSLFSCSYLPLKGHWVERDRAGKNALCLLSWIISVGWWSENYFLELTLYVWFRSDKPQRYPHNIKRSRADCWRKGPPRTGRQKGNEWMIHIVTFNKETSKWYHFLLCFTKAAQCY